MREMIHRLFGGPPTSVVVRLILMSILVGVVLDPWNILNSIRRLIADVWNLGWDAVNWVWRYFLLGAVLVVPIWLLTRLVKAPSGR